jgi:Zn-dependent peptidase ImmA (M78 family)
MANEMRVDVKPELLRWARERVGLTTDALAERFPKLPSWESEETKPTLKQLEKFARATHTSIGYLFLAEPPAIRIPIPDLRTVADREIENPSPDLLDTIFICQERQDWYRDYARSEGYQALSFVGAASVSDNVEHVASAIREALRFDIAERRDMPSWTDALRSFIDRADQLGVLVAVSGIVGNNTHRKLDPGEFRGFALADEYAPVIFINGADSKAAQMFTLAHELAHIWLGESALSDSDRAYRIENNVERWCNEVAAETLVPRRVFAEQVGADGYSRDELPRLARYFKVSQLVILRRYKDVGKLTTERFWDEYNDEIARLRSVAPGGGGGNFYATEGVRVGKRFSRALVGSVLEGHTLYRDALRLLAMKKIGTFHEFAHSIGVA